MVIAFYRSNITAPLARKLLSIQKLQLEITNKCNFRCLFCDQAYREIHGKNLSLERFKIILDKLPNITSLCPQGLGEPLINPDFLKMLELARKKAIHTYINTNFGLFTEDIAEKLALLADSVVISFSGGSKETYETIHRGSSFERTLKNIKRFMEARNKLGENAPSVELKFVITSRNFQEIKDFIKIADDLGIKSVYIDDLVPFKEIEYLKVEKEKAEKEIEPAKKLAQEKGINVHFDLRKKLYRINQCDWPFDNIFIDVDGNTYPCCNIGVFWAKGGSREKVSFGNIFTDDINKIWKGEKYHGLRKMIAQNRAPGVCRMANCLYVQGIAAEKEK